MSESRYNQLFVMSVRHAIALAMCSHGTVSSAELRKIINSAPRSTTEMHDPAWRNTSICWQLMNQANEKKLHSWAQEEFDMCATFWLEIFPYITEEMQLDIIAQFNESGDLYCTTETTPNKNNALENSEPLGSC